MAERASEDSADMTPNEPTHDPTTAHTSDLPIDGPGLPDTIDPDEVAEELRPTWVSRGVDLVVGLVLVVVSLTMASIALGQAGPALRVGSWSGILMGLFSGLGGIHMLRRAMGAAPRLEWDDDALIDRTSILGGELRIPWRDIRDVTTRARDSGVQIEFEDRPSFTETMSPGRRIQFALNRLRGIRGLLINPSFLRIDHRRLGSALEQVMLESEARELRERKPGDLLITPPEGPPPDPPAPPLPQGE